MRKLIFLLSLAVFLNPISATLLTTFNDSQSQTGATLIETTTLNREIGIVLPRDANITSAFFNISAIASNTVGDKNYTTNGELAAIINASYGYDANYTNDNFTSFANFSCSQSGKGADYYKNYTVGYGNKLNISAKWRPSQFAGNVEDVELHIYNHSAGAWVKQIDDDDYGTTYATYSISKIINASIYGIDYASNNETAYVQLWYHVAKLAWGAGSCYDGAKGENKDLHIYDFQLNETTSRVSNLTISIGGEMIFNNSGGPIDSHNRTKDFISELQAYLQDCEDYNCTIPLNISYTAGEAARIKLLDLDIDYTSFDWLTNCSETNAANALNFTLKNESSSAIIGGNTELSFSVWEADDVDTIRNYSFTFTDYSNFSICVQPNHAMYIVDMMAEYGASGFSTRYYHLDNAEVSNATNLIDLYLASSSETTTITVYVKNAANAKVEDAVVLVQLYDVGTNTYTTVEVLKTDFEGKGVINIVTPGWYKFIVAKDGVVLKSFTPIQILTTTTSVTLKLDLDVIGEFFNVYNNIAGVCTFNNVTNVFRCEATDTTGLFRKFEFEVQHNLAAGYSTICNETATTSSVTFTCLLPNVSSVGQGNTYRYSLLVFHQATKSLLKTGYLEFHGSFGAFKELYGTSGNVYFFVLLMVLPLAFAPVPPLAVAMIPAVFFISSLLRFIEVGIEALIAITVVAAVVIFVMEKSKRVAV